MIPLRNARGRFLFAAAALCFWACLFDPPSKFVGGGGSSETTNGIIVGMIRDPAGNPLPGATVLLRPRGWLKDTSQVAADPRDKVGNYTSDSSGKIRIDSVPTGGYFLEARDTLGNACLFEVSMARGDTVVLPAKPLRPTATVRGSVVLDSGIAGAGYVQVFGLERLQRVDMGTGAFAFSDLPEGIYTFRAAASNPFIDPLLVPGVDARSADTVDVGTVLLASFDAEDYSSWPYHRRIGLNTTSSGAFVAGTVTGFPVLIRLNVLNFAFGQSQGTDLRFSSRNGAHLRYEIEKWDPQKGEAAVWVKVDTIPGNSNQSFITLHWGKTGMPDWSSGTSVFDTAAGFGGVWHLKEEAADTVSDRLYADATLGGNHGDDRVANADTLGLVGNGHFFSAADYIRVKPIQTLKPQAQVSVSGWFRASATGAKGGELASMGNNYGLRVMDNGGAYFFVAKQWQEDWVWIGVNDLGLLDTSWHQLTGVYTGKELQIYVDGRLKGSTPYGSGLYYPLGQDFLIGRHGTGESNFKFTGSLDEIRVSTVALSPDWIKLSFENQRLNGTLVEFR